MSLEVLPMRTASAAENMAVDFMMLQRYPRESVARFRHYNWRSPAFTFGYSQKIAFVRATLPPGESFDLCRRPTGGGVVDHRDDWTFSLVIPRGHAIEDLRATQSYREVHEALAGSLRRQGVPATIKNMADSTHSDKGADPSNSQRHSSERERDPTPGVCFERAELYDVVNSETGMKIAGAAQKRNKRGLLFQGSVWRPALGCVIDEEQLLTDFVNQLSTLLRTEPTDVPWPDFNDDEVSGLTENYASSEWMGAR